MHYIVRIVDAFTGQVLSSDGKAHRVGCGHHAPIERYSARELALRRKDAILFQLRTAEIWVEAEDRSEALRFCDDAHVQQLASERRAAGRQPLPWRRWIATVFQGRPVRPPCPQPPIPIQPS